MRKKVSMENIFRKRRIALMYIVTILFGILFVRTFQVMILDQKKYSELLSSLNYSTVYGDSTPRGRILDRNGKVIVDNKAVNTIVFKKENGTSMSEMIELAYAVSPHLDLDVSKITDRAKREFYLYKNPEICNKLITKEEQELYLMKKLSSLEIENLKIERIKESELEKFTETDLKAGYLFYLMRAGYSYSEKIIKSNASDVEFAYISENNDKLKGFDTKIDWVRVYPYGETMRSILGSVSSSSQGIPKEEKDYFLKLGYSLNDRVGLSYLERQYEEYLRGVPSEYEVINSKEMRLIKEGSRGNDIVLSIDIDLQVEVEKIIEANIIRAKGEANTEYYDHSSVIIQDPYTGEVLAMASKKLVNGEMVDNVTSILTSPITPGSVVKGASILVGYNEGAIKIGEKMLDECVKIAGAPKKCSSVLNLGVIDDIEALAKSSNVYQFKTAIRVNGQEYSNGMKLNFNQKAFDKYRNMYKSFGLGVLTGIDLPVESSGYTSIDKSSGNLLDFVMGQYETYTPLQLSQYINTIANGGSRYKVHLLKEVRNNAGKIIYSYKPQILNKIDTKDQYMARMKEGFYAVMHAQGGYGRGYVEDSLDAAGKTGTSQSFLDTNNDGVIDTETITSSFVGYVPATKPKYSIMVTSPNSSHPNSNSNFASLVTLRITKEVTKKYSEMLG
ncbi:MAG: penicillin-binding protein 2 [Mycoplasmatota bacterium]|nr:penicillin-binding protein 2 [Mycoplasmatota bacterium]